MRILLAFFAGVFDACLAGGLAIGMSAFAIGDLPLKARLLSVLGGFLIGPLIGWIIAIPVMLVVGLPLHAFLVANRLTAKSNYAIAGGVFGMIAVAFLVNGTRHHSSASNGFTEMLTIAFLPASIAGAVSFRRVLDGEQPLSQIGRDRIGLGKF